MLVAGMTLRAVARAMRCHHTTIGRLRHRFQLTGAIQDRPRSGAPRVTTAHQDRMVNFFLHAVCSPFDDERATCIEFPSFSGKFVWFILEIDLPRPLGQHRELQVGMIPE